MIDRRIGEQELNMRNDPVQRKLCNNPIEPRRLLDLDPERLNARQRIPQALAGVRLEPLTGVDTADPKFLVSIGQMAQQGGYTQSLDPGVRQGPGGLPYLVLHDTLPNDPDTLAGSGARSWTDRDERMWTITKLFEQTHTDLTLTDPRTIDVGLDQPRNTWLSSSTGL